MTDAAAFWNRIAAKYAKRPVADETSYKRKLLTTQAYLHSDMEVLELGCGTGTTALHHAPFVKSIRATDISSEMINIGREKAEKTGITNLTFEVGKVSDMLAEADAYDVVMAHSLLHLINDKGDTIRAVYRSLRPGGLFVTSTACLDGGFKVMQPFWPILVWLKIVPELRFFSSDTLKQEHLEAGFVIEEEWQPKRPTIFLIARKPQVVD